MKNKKIIVAIGLGIIAGTLHLTYVRGLERSKSGGAKVSVLAVARAVSKGEKINRDNLGTRMIPAAFLDPRAVRSEKKEDIIGLPATLDLEPGQTVLWTDFESRSDPFEKDLASRIEAGKRAVTIQVDQSLSMGGLLRPGHRVDILGTFAPKSSLTAKERVTATLLQNVQVLATGKRIGNEGGDPESTRYSTVTLAMGLEEAELIALASVSGKLSIVLRGHQDLSIVNDVPEKKMNDVYESERRNALQNTNKYNGIQGIERLRAK